MESSISELSVRPYESGDEEAVLAGFNRVFAAADPGFEPRSMAVWRWKFLENPAGWRMWLAFSPKGEVVAQQAGVPIRMVHEGERMLWTQVVDSFADPRYAGRLGKGGLFLRVARTFADAHGGAPPEKEKIMYGLPVERAERIGHKHLGYQPVRNQNAVRAEPARIVPVAPGAAAGVEVEEAAAFPEEVDALFERARAPFGSVAVRDRTYLDWRFVRHPEVPYRVGLARRADGGELLGYAVYRPGSFDGRQGGLIADWWVEPERPAAGDALRAWLVSCAAGDGVEELIGIFPEFCPDFLAFQNAGFRVHPTSFFATAGSFARTFHTLKLYWTWYCTLGDFDRC